MALVARVSGRRAGSRGRGADSGAGTPLADLGAVAGLLGHGAGGGHELELLAGVVGQRVDGDAGSVRADLTPLADRPGVEAHPDDGGAAQLAGLLDHA